MHQSTTTLEGAIASTILLLDATLDGVAVTMLGLPRALVSRGPSDASVVLDAGVSMVRGGLGSNSFVDVVAFEASLHGNSPSAGLSGSLKCRVATPVSVIKPIWVFLNFDRVEEIFKTIEVFSSHGAILQFRGFWPSLSILHDWISKHWRPILSADIQIYPVAKGFFYRKV